MPEKLFKSSLFILFRFKGYLVQRLYKDLIAVAVPATVICIIHYAMIHYFDYKNGLGTENFALPGLMGAALGILLVFRNNTAYDRWWEGRKVLGALVNTSRNFALQASGILPNNKELGDTMRLIAAFPFTLKEHLRQGVILEEIDFIDEECFEKVKRFKHKPNAIVAQIVERRTAKVLWPIITSHVAQGSLIKSDEAQVYKKAVNLGFCHETCCHKKEFVSPTGIHTNTIENVWSNLKAKMKQVRGSQGDNMISLRLDEYLYRYNRKLEGDFFELFVADIRNFYPV